LLIRFQETEGKELRDLLLNIVFMKGILRWITDLESHRSESYLTQAPIELNPLLRNIAASTPISGFITNPVAMSPLLDKLSRGYAVASYVNDMAMLGDHCPVLAQLLVQPPFNSSPSFPQTFSLLLQELATKCVEFYTGMFFSCRILVHLFVALDLSEQAAPPDLQPVTEAFGWGISIVLFII
jgi:hypothetical protein